MSHCFSKRGSPCAQRAQLASPAPCCSHLQLPPGMHTPSDVAHGLRKLKRGPWSQQTQCRLQHTAQLGSLLGEQQWVMASVLVSQMGEGLHPRLPASPGTGAKQTAPPLSQPKNLSVTKETSLQKAST